MTNVQEQQYLDIVSELKHEVLNGGLEPVRDNHYRARLIGRQMRFDLSKGFPLLTHKRVFLRGIFEELMWFLRGQTDNTILQNMNVHIWDQWHDALVPYGYESGNLGAIYGESWRNFGEVKSWEYDDSGFPLGLATNQEGFDQIKWVIDEIKTNPSSSRLIVSAWNPHVHCEVGRSALPPCHTMFQFFVKDGKLSCQLYQRSADFLIGVPFNIASYALLTHIIAEECNLDVGEFIWVGGDIHVYGDQVDFLEEIESAQTYPFPTLKFKERTRKREFDQYQWDDIEIENYQCGSTIAIPVST